MPHSSISDRVVLQRLLDVTIQLNSAGNLDDLLTYIIEAVTQLLDCEAGSLLLFDERHGELRFVASTGSSQEELATIPVPLEGSIAGRVFTTGDPVIQNDLRTSKQHFKIVGEVVNFRTDSLLAVPMSIEGRTTGVLEALNKRSKPFDAKDETLLSGFANQAALAIRNARQITYVEHAYERLQAFEAFRTEFMAIASHELRTPLSILNQALDILQEETTGVQQSFAMDARAAASRMASIIESMTQLEALRLGNVDGARRAVSVRDVLRRLGEEYGPVVRKAGLSFSASAPNVDVSVWSDLDRLVRILGNAILNSVAATEEGGQVHVTCRRDGSGLHLAVTDTGAGLSKQDLARAFDEYFQAEDHMTRKQGGLGIGLAVARKLAALDDATVRLESKGAGHGACFTLTFPDDA
jgi:signal transduction histidine kinase